MNNNEFSTFQSINGDTVIGFTSSKKMENLGWMDAPRVSTFLLDGQDSHTKHLGLVNLFATTHKRPMTFMRNLFEKAAVLEVTPGESITYDLPTPRDESRCFVTEDTSTLSPKPGRDETIFELVLSMEYQKGDVLTYDPAYGEQCIVSEQHEVEPVGDGYRHYMMMVTQDRTKFFPPEFLKPGVSYMKLTNLIGEMGTNYSGINLMKNPAGTLTNEFILGDPRSVETFYTAKAAAMKAPGLKSVSEDMRNKAAAKVEALGGSKDMFFITNVMKNAEGKAGFNSDPSKMRIGPALEYYVLAELAQMEAQSLVFAKAGSFRTSYGNKMINEGAFHQLRRGKIIKYARPGGITFDHIHNAASYIYKNSDIPVMERTILFKVGSMAHKNLMHLFREEAVQQANTLPAVMLGTTSQISGNVFSGPLDNLTMKAVMITGVTVPGIGQIRVELDESLDYQPMADKQSAGFYGSGVAWTSYSMIIEDATDPIYSNVTKAVKGAKLVENGSQQSNTYYVKPEDAHVVFGYEQGRMANDGRTSYVQSSLKTMGRSFWATSNSACLILDITRQVVIEMYR